MFKRILGVLSYIGMALVFGAFGIRVARLTGVLDYGPEWDRYLQWAAYAGLALVLLYTVGQWREIATYFRRRSARYGALASASVLIVLGILVAVNYLAFKQNKRWDLTANRQYTLSEQSVKLLQGLTAPVKFVVFEQEANMERFRSRLSEYAYHSSNVEVEYIDPDKRPVQAKEYEIQTYGTVVVDYMGRRERVTTDSEPDITNALIKVLNPQQKKVYFLAGHGEKDPADTERTGYSTIVDTLRRDNYEFEKLILAQTNTVPDDATVIVVPGPQTDLLEAEVGLLRGYLERQGKLLVMLDPAVSLKEPLQLPRLTGLLREWGINATDSVIVDVSGLTNVATVPVAAPPYPNHVVTDRFNLITMFPTARAVVAATDAPPDRTAQPLVQTTPRAWAETNLASLETPESLQPDPDKGDTAGPVTIAVALAVPAKADAEAAAKTDGDEQRNPETRVAVFGDSDFVANAYLGIEGNGDLFMNTVNWLAQQEGLIAIRPKEAADRRLTMTANNIQTVFWLSIFVVPAIVLGAGVLTWWRRR